MTGMGVLAPNGHGVEAFADALQKGRSGLRFLPLLKELNFACQVGGVPPGLEEIHRQYFPTGEKETLSDNVRLSTVAAVDAWRDAGLVVPEEGAEVDWDTGAIIGSGLGGMDIIAHRVVPAVQEGRIRRLGSFIVEQVMHSAASAHIAGILALGNQVTANSSACSTGNEAILEAAIRIREGKARRMLAGGVEGPSPYLWAGFDAMRVLCRRFNDEPEKSSRPMSASAGGFVPGSGAAVLVLEALECARDRGARIYAEILGGAVNCGGQRNGGTMTSPNPEGVRRCIRSAVADAGISSTEVDAINGHLTATVADPQELQGWSRALEREARTFPLINATKSMIGHCLGAAGAIECAAVALQLHRNFLHPSLNCEDIHPAIADFSSRIPRTAVPADDITVIAKAGFGFGDVNSCLLFKKWIPEGSRS